MGPAQSNFVDRDRRATAKPSRHPQSWAVAPNSSELKLSEYKI